MSRDHKHVDEENTNALADKLKKQLSDSSDPELKQEHKIKTQRRISSSRNLDDLSTPPGDSETPPEEKFGDKLRESVPQDEKHEHPLNNSLVLFTKLKKTGLMSPSMVSGYVSPLETVTKTFKNERISNQPLIPDGKKKISFNRSLSSKPFVLSPVIKLEHHDQEFDRHSLKHEDHEKIDKTYGIRKEIDEDGSIDEALLSDADEMESFYEDGEDGEDWRTLLGMLALLLTLFGQSSIGVIANMVPTSDGFV